MNLLAEADKLKRARHQAQREADVAKAKAEAAENKKREQWFLSNATPILDALKLLDGMRGFRVEQPENDCYGAIAELFKGKAHLGTVCIQRYTYETDFSDDCRNVNVTATGIYLTSAPHLTRHQLQTVSCSGSTPEEFLKSLARYISTL